MWLLCSLGALITISNFLLKSAVAKNADTWTWHVDLYVKCEPGSYEWGPEKEEFFSLF